jgi:hypothetical protein
MCEVELCVIFVEDTPVTHVAPMLPNLKSSVSVVCVERRYLMGILILILKANIGVRIASMKAVKLRR